MTITSFQSKVLVAHEKSPAAPGYGATSATALAIGTGNKSFITQADTALKAGQAVRLIHRGDPTKYMEGPIVSYTDSAMVVNVGAVGGAGTFADWDIVPVWLPDYVATKTGTETLSNKTIAGAFNIVTSGARTGITNDVVSIAAPPALLTVHNKTGETTNTLNTRGYWTGTTAAPYQNNDCILTEVFNDVQSNSLNRSWALSAPNGYNNIPAGVTDTGSRVGVIGWAVSVARTGYVHEGTLASQIGVQGNCGFQGTGSGASAIIQDAIGVRGEVYNDSTGSTIQNGRAGAFVAAAPGIVQNNYAVYALAQYGTVTNYSFYGAAGKLRNEESAEIGADLTVSGALNLNGNVTTPITMAGQRFAMTNGGMYGELSQNGTNLALLTNAARSAGQYMVLGTSTWVSLSDARVKDGVQELSVLPKLDAFRAVSYRNKLTGKAEIGAIAQEQYALFPEFVVKGNDDPALDIKTMMDEGTYGLSYERYGVVALQAVKELLALVRAQSERISALESRSPR